jgi:uncharacterized membrane protein YphA (DoxX/SURF4 family)
MKTTINNLLFGTAQTNSALFDWCYLFFRIYAGLSIADGAGRAKVFHKINEKGPDTFDNLRFGPGEWFVNQVSDLGFTFISPTFWAYLAVYGEFLGGLLIAFGLFTRLSSIQLAFQFFVVAFIWYGDPAPFLGMYYQQLIFWSFVMTYGGGDGKYSLTTLIARLRRRRLKPTVAVVAGLLVVQSGAFAQQDASTRVSFSVSNPTVRHMSIEFISYDAQHRKVGDYGYGLNAFETHPTNMPAPVRIYRTHKGKRELILVVKKSDEGKTFALNKTYEVSQDELQAALFDEANASANPHDDGDAIENVARRKGVKMVTIRLKNSSMRPKNEYIRYQLPWNAGSVPTGVTFTMSRAKAERFNLPVGTKVYVCSDKYWDKSVSYTERLIVTVDESTANGLFNF